MAYFYTVSVCFVLCHPWVGVWVLEKVKFCICVLELFWFILVSCFLEYPALFSYWHSPNCSGLGQLHAFPFSTEGWLLMDAYGCVQTFIEILKYPINCHIWNNTEWMMSKNLNRKVKQRGCQNCFTIKSTNYQQVFLRQKRSKSTNDLMETPCSLSAEKLHEGKYRQVMPFGQKLWVSGLVRSAGCSWHYFESGLLAVQHLVRPQNRSFILKRFLDFIPG